ncbi:tonB family C-terminal domain protein [Collimonas arenae]|uniref:TonB family C-terminal domain protein n=1 Tax=Collimonas arenae TaxID=279058 RepID=A0A127QQF4_9BURK|nr:energy transducer TonB [Collimonas arenae]AMP02292.1 tonB family C-terminal domain protein [Collimonas arenae]AMP12187.1 tonB family C-terminal domain protein [Collimonas arenae]
MNAKTRMGLYCATAVLMSGCSGLLPGTRPPIATTTPDATSTASTLDDYKRALAQRIVAVNSTAVYVGRPQALLRAVIVVKYYVDADGKLLRTEIIRTNKDRRAETSALTALRRAAPFPKPESKFLRRGEVEIAESWLFNDDGRFQLRSIAEQQMDE